MPSLGLYELLAPQFLAGFTFPEHIDSYLSLLEVVDLQTAVAEDAIVHSGRVQFGSGQSGTASHQAPGDTGVLRWSDVGLQFRLTVPRNGSTFIDTALTDVLALRGLPASLSGAVTSLKGLFDALGPPDATATLATDYPGLAFRLEMLVSLLTFHMSTSYWLPGQFDAATSRVVPKPVGPGDPPDVRFVLPRIALVYTQGEDFSIPPTFAVTSWGDTGFDAGSDLAEGEIVRMEPPIALKADQTFAFGVDRLGVDASPDSTPAELLGRFGIDEGWTGIHCKAVQLYVSQENKGWAFNLGVRDLLVSFSGDVWLEARADLIGPAETFVVEPIFLANGQVQPASPPNAANTADGQVTLPPDGRMQVAMRGGKPPFQVAVTIANSAGSTDIWNSSTMIAALDQGGARPPDDYTLTVAVTDAASTTRSMKYRLTIAAKADSSARGLAADLETPRPDLPAAVLTAGARPADAPASYNFSLLDATQPSPVVVINGPSGASLTVNGQPVALSGNRASIPVPAGSAANPLTISVAFPAQTSTETRSFTLFFSKGEPNPAHTETQFTQSDLPRYRGAAGPRDPVFDNSRPPGQGSGPASGPGGATAFRQWLQSTIVTSENITLRASASFEKSSSRDRDKKLSERRLAVVRAIASDAGISPPPGDADGHLKPGTTDVNDPPDNPQDRKVVVTGKVSVPNTAAVTLTATLGRPAAPVAPPLPAPPPAPNPKPPANAPPSVFRRAHLRFGLERSQPTLFEIGGQFDFETELEGKLRNSAASDGGTIAADAPNLDLTPDGVADFRLTITYDPATFSLTEELAAGAAPAGNKGLAFRAYPAGNGGALVNSTGALLAMTPVINSVAASVDPRSAGDWVTLGASVAVPLTLGLSGILKTSALTFYGMAIKSRQYVPPGEPLRVANVGIIFDYGVDLLLNIPELGITSRGPIKLRYNAVGMRLNFASVPMYEPIFDTSKGYSLAIRDPNLIKLPSPLDNILRILAVRMARVNPLTLELDLALKVDLGILTVESFKVTWPIDPLGAPQILPSGVKLDVPGVIIGEGIVNIIQPPSNPPADQPSGGGFEGMVDVTLVAMRLRIAASIGVRDIQQQTPPRRAVAIFLGLSVRFPAPILIGQSGLGLYGLSGLFAMHYRRMEDDPNPDDAIGPALHWLAKIADGEPEKLLRADSTRIWDVELDRWSFGVGAIMGTVEGGFLALVKGTLVLELPGPRILIFVNIKMLSPPIKTLKPAAELTTGILGVLDLDFNLGRVTVGVLIDMKLGQTGDLLSISIPIELFFNLRDSSDWHFYIGTFQAKVTARILNLFDAYGYLMVSGGDIVGWPGRGDVRTLPGLAVAAGFGAAIEIGSRSIRLYARAELLVDAAVSFNPVFFIGTGQLTGELCIFIITLEVSGRADIEGPDPVWAKLELCGSIKILWKRFHGCVSITYDTQRPELVAPDLVSGVFLQSHAPVLTAGQATERPIDASLGNAVAVGSGAPLPVVPIDTVLVVQMIAPPSIDGTVSFTDPLKPPPNALANGMSVGADARVRYELLSISLDPPLVGSGAVPATWRLDPGSPAGGSRTNIDLALLSRVPVTGERALERSSSLNGLVDLRWRNLCDPPAPPTCILWTFCDQPLGPADRGWTLAGHPAPDPPGTVRSSPPPVRLQLRLPVASTADAQRLLLAPIYGWSLLPAMVIAGDCGSRKPPVDPDEPRNCLLKLIARLRAVLCRGIACLRALLCRWIACLRALLCRWVACLRAVLCRGIARIREILFSRRLIRPPDPAPRQSPDPIDRPAGDEKSADFRPRPAAVARQDMLAEGRFGFADGPPRTTDTTGGTDVCCRALRLPRGQAVAPPAPLTGEDNDIQQAIAAAVEANACVEILLDRAARVRLLVGLTATMRAIDALVIEECTASGAVISRSTLDSLGAIDIAVDNGNLPVEWRNGAAGWDNHVRTALAVIRDPAMATPVATLADFVPVEETRLLRLRITASQRLRPGDQALLALLETRPISEIERHRQQEDIRTGEITTLSQFSDVNAPARLLQPNTRYRLAIQYQAIVIGADGTERQPVIHGPTFDFQTDAAPPRRLDAYVMGINPDDGEAKVFTSDPVKLVFNDAAVKALYEAYGKSLVMVLRSADGAPIPAASITRLELTDAAFATPYREALAAMADALPCLAGRLTRPLHATATGPFTLLPEMAYTLDVELSPPNPPGPDDKPSTPLFRRRFTTGRFADMAALAADLEGRKVHDHRLSSRLAGLPPLIAEHTMATDIEIENSLVAAGMDRLPATTTAAIHLLWAPGSDGRQRPHALLIDAPEPLWRTRAAHRTEVVPQPPLDAAAADPAFRRLVTAREDSLVLREKPPAGRVAGFVRAPSGTRTLVLLDASAAGNDVAIDLHRPASALFGIAAATIPLLALKLDAIAPWEVEA